MAFFIVTLLFGFPVGVGAFDIGRSQMSSLFHYICPKYANVYVIKI